MASHGVEVIGTDYNKELVATLNAGKTTFKEDGLDQLFTYAVKSGIKFTTDIRLRYVHRFGTYSIRQILEKSHACYVVGAIKDVMKVCPKEQPWSLNRLFRLVR